MFVSRTWYVAARSAELNGAPLGRTIGGRRLAIYRDAGGEVHALDALCPHRGADLACGRVVENTLQCPFHGFRFNGSGRCVEVPSQQDQTRIPERLGVNSYPMREQQGFLWIWMDAASAPDREPPRYPFFDAASGFRRYQCKTELYGSSYLNVMENALDGGHLAFIHTGSIPGVRREVGNSTITAYDDGRGYRGEDNLPVADPEYLRRRRKRSWSIGSDIVSRWLRNLATPFLELSPVVRSGFIYELCGIVCFDENYANGKTDFVLALITPCDETSTWFFAESARNRALNPLGDWVTRKFMDTLVGEDREAQKLLLPEARGPSGLPRPALVHADRTSTPFRRIYGAALRREGKRPPWAMEMSEAIDISHGAGPIFGAEAASDDSQRVTSIAR